MAHNEWNKVVLGKSGRKRSGKSLLKKSGGRKKIFKTSKAKNGSSKNNTTGAGGIVVLIILGILFWKYIAIILGIAIVAVLIYLFVNKDNSVEDDTVEKEIYNETVISPEKRSEIDRIFEIMSESQALVNTSCNVETVKGRLDLLIKMIDTVDNYEENELKAAGYTKRNQCEQKTFIVNNYDTVINQAIERAYEKEKNDAQSLKTVAGRDRRIQNFFDKLKNIEWLTEVNKNFITTLEDDYNGGLHENKTIGSENSENMNDCFKVNVEDDSDIPSLETRIKGTYPSKNGLYPHEILMLNYANTFMYYPKSNQFQGFWHYQYSVKEPQKVLDSLYDRGFLTTGNLRLTIEKMKVVELKAELQNANEKTTGKKADLVERLMEKANLKTLEEKYPNRYYALTEKGVKEVQDNEYVEYLHKTKYMSIWDMNVLLNTSNPLNLDYRDILWREFNNQSEDYFRTGNMGLYRNVRMNMYQFLMENKKIEEAFGLLCEVVLYDLSGMSNNEQFINTSEFRKWELENLIKYGFPYNSSLYTIPPAVVGWLETIKDELHLSERDFQEALLENFEKISLKKRIFTNSECVEIVMNEMGNHPRKLAAIYKQAEERLKDEMKGL